MHLAQRISEPAGTGARHRRPDHIDLASSICRAFEQRCSTIFHQLCRRSHPEPCLVCNQESNSVSCSAILAAGMDRMATSHWPRIIEGAGSSPAQGLDA
jgi:hypothetical protein